MQLIFRLLKMPQQGLLAFTPPRGIVVIVDQRRQFLVGNSFAIPSAWQLFQLTQVFFDGFPADAGATGDLLDGHSVIS